MPFHKRFHAMRRHQLWGELCALSEQLYQLADELHEMTLYWWDADPDLVDAHHDRCRIRDDEPGPAPPSSDDDPEL